MKNKICGLLGICRKAGKIKLGFDPVVDRLQKDAVLILFAADISPKTKQRLLQKAEGLPCTVRTLPCTQEELFCSIGKRVGVMAVTDRGLAAALEQLCDQAVPNHQQEEEPIL